MPLKERPSSKDWLRTVWQETAFGFKFISTSASNSIWCGILSKNNYKSVRCLERFFSEFKAFDDFCTQLKNGAFEGLCDCVCTRFIEWMDGKIKPCIFEHSTHGEFRQFVFLRSWERSEQVQNRRRDYFECLCPVSSSYGVGNNIWDNVPDTANLVRYSSLALRSSIAHDFGFQTT